MDTPFGREGSQGSKGKVGGSAANINKTFTTGLRPMENREPLLRARVAGSWWLVAGGPASHRHPERKRRISVKIASDSNASKYQSAGRLYSRRGLRLRRRGAYGPVLTHGPRVVFAVVQGAKTVVGAFKNNWAPVCIKPYNRPCGRWKSGPLWWLAPPPFSRQSRGHYGYSAVCYMTLQESVERLILPPE